MATITISLDEGQCARLEELARQRGQTPEDIIVSWVDSMLAPAQPNALTPYASTLDLSGSLDDLNIEPFVSNEIIDRLLAEEAVNQHDDDELSSRLTLSGTTNGWRNCTPIG